MCILLIQTYIEDCYRYTPTEQSHTNTSGTNTVPVFSDWSWDNTEDWECSYDMKLSHNSQRIDLIPPSESLNHHIGIGKSDYDLNAIWIGKATSGETRYTPQGLTVDIGSYNSFTIIKQGTTVTIKEGDTTVWSDTISWLSNYSTESLKYTHWGNNRTIYIKNVKIKPL